MKVFILIHKKHAHIVSVYSNKEMCEEAIKFLNEGLIKKPYEIIEKELIYGK